MIHGRELPGKIVCIYVFAIYLMDSPCRRPERAVVADAAVVLLHAVVVVRSIVRNLDTSVLMNCGCLSHHFQPRLLCSLRRWPCTHHPLLFSSQAHNLNRNSKLNCIDLWRLFFWYWYRTFQIRSRIKIANGQGIFIYRLYIFLGTYISWQGM